MTDTPQKNIFASPRIANVHFLLSRTFLGFFTFGVFPYYVWVGLKASFFVPLIPFLISLLFFMMEVQTWSGNLRRAALENDPSQVENLSKKWNFQKLGWAIGIVTGVAYLISHLTQGA